MVGYYGNTGVPASADLENNHKHNKYTVNQNSEKGVHISKPLCTLMAIGAVLLAVLVGLVVFFTVPRGDCSEMKMDAPGKLMASNPNSNGALKSDEIDERLPRSLLPTHYRIQIIPDFDNSKTTGTVTITLNAVEDTRSIIFHLNEIKIDEDSVVVKTKDAKTLPVKNQEYIEGHRYKITLGDTLKSGQEYLLDLKFNGQLNKHLQGFYEISYNDEINNIKKNAASTQFSPTDARRAFPCFDEPFFKARFTISIARPATMISLSNMPLNNTDLMVEKKDWYWDHYPVTPKMSTYLVAFIVGEIETQSPKDSFIRVWSQPHLLHQTAYANELAPKILKFFENYFNISFPLPKIDIVAVPEFGFSAMENWGLITFRESSLLYDPTTTTIEQETSIALVLGHEIAHQWFGNLVTPKWWNDLWLKEGFSTYLEYLGINHVKPNWKIIDEFISSETARAFDIDALESSRPISFTVTNSRQIRQTFDEISYAKGACLIRMMNHFLGEQAFKNGLINFLNQYKYGNADRDDLFRSLTEEGHKAKVLNESDTVKVIMDSWTEQPGFPVITAIADRKSKTLTISQKRFLYTSSEEHDATWWVPISITTDLQKNFNETKPSVWLRGEKSTTTDLNFNEWYLLNMNQSGYYIVNYDETNWRALITNIMKLDPLIRAQLISDSMDLARANLLSYDIPLRMISVMATRDMYVIFVPTMIALNKLLFLYNILSNTPAFGLFQEFHQTIFRNTYGLVDLTDNGDDYLTKRIRTVVLNWSCKSSESQCVHEARGMYRDWMATGGKKVIPPNLREIVYCTAIREGNRFEWNFAYDQYLATQIPAERNVLLDALGCTKESWLLSRYLDKLIDENSSIRIQDADRVFASVSRNKIGTTLAFDFLRRNWNKLQEQYGDGFNILAKMIKSLAPNMNTEFQLEEFIRFRDSIKDNISTTTQAFDSAIQKIKANVEWMDKNYDNVEKWLSDHKNNYDF